MEKRGQFFLVAALIIIGLFFVFSTVYNSASASTQSKKTGLLAKEIKYEALETLNYAVYNDLTFDVTNSTLKTLMDSYAKLNPDYVFIGMFKSLDGGNLSVFRYEKGAEKTNLDEWKWIEGFGEGWINISSIDRNIYYGANASNRSNNFYVLVENERGKERNVAFE